MVLRIVISQNLLNQYVGYTTGTGFIGGRFHPATYMLILVLTLYLCSLAMAGLRIRDRGRRHLIALVPAVFAVVLALNNGGQNAAAVVVDLIIAPVLMAFLLTQLDEDRRSFFYRVIVGLVAFNLVLVAFEKATSIPIFPRDRSLTEMYFRPQGYLEHPLMAGVAVFCSMWAVLRLGRRPSTDLALSGILLLQLMLLGVRMPLVVGTVIFILQILKLGRKTEVGKVAAGFFLIVIPPALFAIAVTLGWLDRFFALGLYDESSAGSRLVAFDLLGALNGRALWTGLPNDQVTALMERYGVIAIENSFVSYTLLAGLGVAILVHLAIVISIMPALLKDVLFVGITAAIFGGTIVFSVKTSAFMIFLLLCTIVVERWESERRQRIARNAARRTAPSVVPDMAVSALPQAVA
ncbi:hypothetical protein CG471_22195 [Sphingobium sp. IP1]|uniref:hypothetical protein n=1 Tax=Sphingobium sp. IP1 TaxID=2021637 RepID=UPI000C086898|nr:hypothetical protein [Sphingobium sp. IP1]PHP17561.1 hypothetical protein CG471_22195 [Sphingobium sp. IP1]